MNISIILYILGWILKFEAAFLTLPCIVALIYKEKTGIAFGITLLLCLVLGVLLTIRQPKNNYYYAKEGFVTVALAWIVMSLFGALPFFLTGEIPSYVDALFETISGFTTTGSTIIGNIEVLSHATLFWRVFTNWIGGMGVLVFVLAILPLAGGQNMHLMRAESPGPAVSKIVPHIRQSAMILYLIYIGLTILQVGLLVAGKMPVFDAITTSLATAGTGGFGIKNTSIADYSTYIQAVTTVFMILFGVNFNVYYLLLIKRSRDAFKSEEARGYIAIILVSILLITINVQGMFESLGAAFHHSAFSVATIITTTGFSTVDFNLWPSFSKTILIILMFVGACAGSTGGGIKVSRFIILFKTIKKEIAHFIHPRSVKVIKFDGKKVEHETLRSINVYLVIFFLIFSVSILLVSLDGYDLVTNFTSVATTMNNIGPGFSLVGPSGNFGFFSDFSKIVLMADMLIGRLEIFPIILLFTPSTWSKS